MNSDISPTILEKSPLILAEIQKAQSILLHCHPSPDPDSVGSVLATKFALEQIGKKVTIIKGDSAIPNAFMHFPGVKDIIQKNLFEIDLKTFDLFLILDSGSPEQISRLGPISSPWPLYTIVIDHHSSNKGYADINLIEFDYPATAQILFDLFSLWNIKITHDIAVNLFMGIYTDTGGFKYPRTKPKTFVIASELVRYAPDFVEIISNMENSGTPGDIAFKALALSSIETFFEDKFAISIVSQEALTKKSLILKDIQAHSISPTLRTVAQWMITGVMVESEPNKIKLSFRSKDSEKYDVSKLALALGGGGHKAAAGSTLNNMSIEEAKKLVVSKVKELYNL